MLRVMMQITEYPFGIHELAKLERVTDYLGREHARNKEIFDLKKELVAKIKESS